MSLKTTGTSNMPRMSNTAEIVTKQFRATLRRNSTFSVDRFDRSWSLKKIKDQLCDFFLQQHSSLNSDINELFPKYLVRLQHNFFVSLLVLNIFFNVIVMVVAIIQKSDSQYPGILYLNLASLVVFVIFLIISYVDEHLLRPKVSRIMASITILMAMIFTEYGYELLQMHHNASHMLQRIRPTIYIIIANHIFLLFPLRILSFVATLLIICLELAISLKQRIEVCENVSLIVKMTISDCIIYLYAALFGMYISRMLEIIIRKAFRNHHKYIESKFNIYQEQEQQQQLLNSCFPRHLIEDVRKDLKDIIRVLDRQEKTKQSPFKKLYVKKYDDVSILYADIVNSMLLTSSLSPNDLVETLNDLFGRFDEVAEANNCLRIKLLGDCYYCVSGLPKYDSNHALNCIRMGLDMIDIIKMVRNEKSIDVNMRIGIHSGMVLSGIIGVHKWQFDIWSEDSILASSMEHDGFPGCVFITRETLDLVPEIALKNYLVEERISNERIGYVISRKLQCNSLERISNLNKQNNRLQMKDQNTTRLKENVYRLRKRSSFSTIRARESSGNIIHEYRGIQKYLEKKNKVNQFIDHEIENMPLSFKSNFGNFHGIHPFFLNFKNLKSSIRLRKSSKTSPDSSEPKVGLGSSIDGTNLNHSNQNLTTPIETSNWNLEKEFLALNDDFFIFYLFFSLVLCFVIGVIKGKMVPHFNSLIITLTTLCVCFLVIFASIFYSYRISKNLSFAKRNIIWFTVATSLLICSLHDIILYGCSPDQTQNDDQPDSVTNCPYLWSFTMCIILSMTGASVFIRINLWLKILLHVSGLIGFSVALFNKCSLYQIMVPQINSLDNKWVSNAGFDPIFSHFYYVSMIVVILCIIDRQIEYIFRLDFKLSKRLKEEKLEAKIMAEINDILLKNILPTFVVQKYLNNTNSFTDQIYSESYKFCAVMFASIPNYSEFYSENKLNDNGIKCLQLLNEIICDFDQLLSQDRFHRIEKIKTIGSTYMTAAGLRPGKGSNNISVENESNNVMSSIYFAMALMQTLKQINKDALQDFKLRIGIAVGPMIAGIVGATKPQYDIWGDTVNVASRMESTGVIGRIQITKETADVISKLEHSEEFTLENRGPIQVKGKGNLVTFLVKTRFDFEEKEITHV